MPSAAQQSAQTSRPSPPLLGAAALGCRPRRPAAPLVVSGGCQVAIKAKGVDDVLPLHRDGGDAAICGRKGGREGGVSWGFGLCC